MQINFSQGIIRYGQLSGLQTFLTRVPSTSTTVALSTSSDICEVAFAHKDSNYLLTEVATVPIAWGTPTGVPSGVDVWLFWDLNTTTAVRTFGFTLLAPVYGSLPPSSPALDQHWFNTNPSVRTMYVWTGAAWSERIRVFAAKVNNGTFTALGAGVAGQPFAGTQAGLSGATLVGRVIYDENGLPIRRSNGTFFTTESQFYINGSPVNTLKFEANVLTALADEGIAAFHVVKIATFGTVDYAGYNDLGTTFIAMAMESALVGETLTMASQGTITNSSWAWTTPGASLWVLENGELTETDPHVSDPVTYPVAKQPVARVMAADTIFFDQGLGIPPSTALPTIPLASTTQFGTTKLSVAPAVPSNPIAVGDNDPRMSNSRTPNAHGHPASAITTAPYQTLTGATLDLQLQQIQDQKLAKAGGTMTGNLTVSGANVILSGGTSKITIPNAPVAGTDGVNKTYVDSVSLTDLDDVAIVGPTSAQVLSYNGTDWVNSTVAGPAEPNTQIVYGTGISMDSSPTLTYNVVNGAFSLSPAANNTVGDVNINAADALSGNNDGGDVNISAGTKTGTGVNGIVSLTGGNGDLLQVGASIRMSTSGVERLEIESTGAWQVGGAVGPLGQVIMSGGPGTPPTWAPSPGGGAEPDTQVVYGAGGGTTVDSSPTFTYDVISGAFNVNPGEVDTPGDIFIVAASSLDDGSGENGGNVSIEAGNAAPAGSSRTGGSISMSTGSTPSGDAGDFIIETGSGTNGGSFEVTLGSFAPSTQGFGSVEFTVAKVGTDPTGLANDLTVYSIDVSVDGAAPITISFAGQDAQTFTDLFNQLNFLATPNNLGTVGSFIFFFSDTIARAYSPTFGSSSTLTFDESTHTPFGVFENVTDFDTFDDIGGSNAFGVGGGYTLTTGDGIAGLPSGNINITTGSTGFITATAGYNEFILTVARNYTDLHGLVGFHFISLFVDGVGPNFVTVGPVFSGPTFADLFFDLNLAIATSYGSAVATVDFYPTGPSTSIRITSATTGASSLVFHFGEDIFSSLPDFSFDNGGFGGSGPVGTGGNFSVALGYGDGGNTGGSFEVFAGNGNANGNGGYITLDAGDGGISSGSAGQVQIFSGSASNATENGGGITFVTGGGGFNGGDVLFNLGSGAASNGGGFFVNTGFGGVFGGNIELSTSSGGSTGGSILLEANNQVEISGGIGGVGISASSGSGGVVGIVGGDGGAVVQTLADPDGGVLLGVGTRLPTSVTGFPHMPVVSGIPTATPTFTGVGYAAFEFQPTGGFNGQGMLWIWNPTLAQWVGVELSAVSNVNGGTHKYNPPLT